MNVEDALDQHDRLDRPDKARPDPYDVDADDAAYTVPLIDYDSPAVAAAFDELYPVVDDAPQESSAKTSGRVIAAGTRHANPDLWVTAAEAEKRWGIPAWRVHRWHWRGTVKRRGYRGKVPVFALPDLRRLNRLAALDWRSVENRDAA